MCTAMTEGGPKRSMAAAFIEGNSLRAAMT
jgi:hypothetical protein